MHDGSVADGHAGADDAVACGAQMHAAVFLDAGSLADDDLRSVVAAQRGVEQDDGVFADGYVANEGGVGRDARFGMDLELTVVHVGLLVTGRSRGGRPASLLRVRTLL